MVSMVESSLYIKFALFIFIDRTVSCSTIQEFSNFILQRQVLMTCRFLLDKIIILMYAFFIVRMFS